jgi:Bacterial Ig domain
MNMQTGLAAVAAVVVFASAAHASCRVVGTPFRVHLNESVTSTGVSTKGGACGIRLSGSATGHFTSTSITARPAHGTLTQVDSSRFRYKPAAGFKGVDHYSFKVCGTNDAGSGCATLTYNITVE